MSKFKTLENDIMNADITLDKCNTLVSIIHKKHDMLVANKITKNIQNMKKHYLAQFVINNDSNILRYQENDYDYHYMYYLIKLNMEDFSCSIYYDYNCRYDNNGNAYNINIYLNNETCILDLNFDDVHDFLDDCLNFEATKFTQKTIKKLKEFDMCNVNAIKKLANGYSYYGIEFIRACIELLLDVFEDKQIQYLNESKFSNN